MDELISEGSMPAQPAGFNAKAVYAWYVVVVLALGHLVSFIDRTIMSLVVQPMKVSLSLSDTGIGLLVGLGFAILYVIFGLPLGRLADTANRRLIIVAGIFFWSVMTALCGFARNVPELFIARIGVGLGEAALIPAAMSLLTDYLPQARLARAVSVLTMGAALGKSASLIGGGATLTWLNGSGGFLLDALGGLQPWQGVLVCAAIPGLVVALLALTIKEPPRSASIALNRSKRFSIADTFRHLFANRRAYGGHFLAACVVIVLVQGISVWTPTFLVRKFHMTVAHSGYVFGLVVISAGLLGNMFGGWNTDRLRARGRLDAPERHIFGALLVALAPGIAFCLVPNVTLAIICLWLYYATVSTCTAPTLAGVQLITSARRRGVVTAIYLGAVNLAGFGLGPAFVGALNDYVFRQPAALPYSLAIAIVLLVVLGMIAACIAMPAYRALARSVQDETQDLSRE
jgi:MFS family permease